MSSTKYKCSNVPDLNVAVNKTHDNLVLDLQNAEKMKALGYHIGVKLWLQEYNHIKQKKKESISGPDTIILLKLYTGLFGEGFVEFEEAMSIEKKSYSNKMLKSDEWIADVKSFLKSYQGDIDEIRKQLETLPQYMKDPITEEEEEEEDGPIQQPTEEDKVGTSDDDNKIPIKRQHRERHEQLKKEQEYEQLQKELQQAKSDLQAFQTVLQSGDQRQMKDKEQIIQLRGEVERLNGEYHLIRQENENMKEQFQQAQVTYKGAQEQYNNAEKEFINMKSTLDSKTTEMSQLNNQLNTTIQNAKLKIDELNSSLINKNLETTQLHHQLQTANQNLQNEQKIHAETKSNAKYQIDKLNTLISEKDSVIMDIQEKMTTEKNTLNEQIRKITADKDLTEAQKTQLVGELTTAQEEIKRFYEMFNNLPVTDSDNESLLSVKSETDRSPPEQPTPQPTPQPIPQPIPQIIPYISYAREKITNKDGSFTFHVTRKKLSHNIPSALDAFNIYLQDQKTFYYR